MTVFSNERYEHGDGWGVMMDWFDTVKASVSALYWNAASGRITRATREYDAIGYRTYQHDMTICYAHGDACSSDCRCGWFSVGPEGNFGR